MGATLLKILYFIEHFIEHCNEYFNKYFNEYGNKQFRQEQLFWEGVGGPDKGRFGFVCCFTEGKSGFLSLHFSTLLFHRF